MPPLLRATCIALAFLIAFHSVLALRAGESMALALVPIGVDAVLLWLLWSFLQRTDGTLEFLTKAAPVMAALTVVFGFAPNALEAWPVAVRTHAVLEGVVWLALYLILRSRPVVGWFRGTSDVPGNGA
jgi:hypothetical protein